MEHTDTNTENIEERYCEVLRAYYERLNQDRSADTSTIATEEVKLRLFLSLLDRTRESPHAGSLSASIL